MRVTTNQLYKYAKTENEPLLGENNFDFFQPYLAAFNVFDRYFRDKFLNWFYWISFDDSTTIASIYDDFVEAIQAHLTINQKRYSELYRVQVLAANAYDIVNNYDLTESHSTSRSESGSNTSGAREDSTSGTATDGARSDSATTNAGAQTTTETNQIEGFNSSDFADADKKTIAAGAHSDSTSVSKGAQTNTNSTTVNKGSQTDSHSLTGSETINIRRTGNIGVQTAADVIGGHLRLWESFNFYKLIFDEIAKDFLLLDNDYAYDTGSASGGGDTDVIMAELKKIEAQIALTAKSSELTGLAKSSELAGLAKSSDLAGLAKSSELAGLAKSSELAGLATSSEANSISLSVESLRASTLAYKNEIVNSIEGVSTNEY